MSVGPKYSGITLDLIRNKKDFRPERFKPRRGVDEPIQVGETIGPGQPPTCAARC